MKKYLIAIVILSTMFCFNQPLLASSKQEEVDDVDNGAVHTKLIAGIDDEEYRNKFADLKDDDYAGFCELPRIVNSLMCIFEIFALTDTNGESQQDKYNQVILNCWEQSEEQPQEFLRRLGKEDLKRLLRLEGQLLEIFASSGISLRDWIVKSRQLAVANDESTLISLLDITRVIIQSMTDTHLNQARSYLGLVDQPIAEFSKNICIYCTKIAAQKVADALTLIDSCDNTKNSSLRLGLLASYPNLRFSEDQTSWLAGILPLWKVMSVKTFEGLLSELLQCKEILLYASKVLIFEEDRFDNDSSANVGHAGHLGGDIMEPEESKQKRSEASEELLLKSKKNVSDLKVLVRQLLDINKPLQTTLVKTQEELGRVREELDKVCKERDQARKAQGAPRGRKRRT